MAFVLLICVNIIFVAIIYFIIEDDIKVKPKKKNKIQNEQYKYEHTNAWEDYAIKSSNKHDLYNS